MLVIIVIILKFCIRDYIINPINGCGGKITLDINPIYVELEMSSPRDSKDVWLLGGMGSVKT